MAGPVSPHHVGHPAGGEAVPVAGGPVCVCRGRFPISVVLVCDADVESGGGVVKPLWRQRCVGERLRGDLEQEPVLGVERACFPRADPEVLGVEPEHLVEEPTTLGQ